MDNVGDLYVFFSYFGSKAVFLSNIQLIDEPAIACFKSYTVLGVKSTQLHVLLFNLV